MRENRWNPLAGAASVTRRQVTKSAGALGLLAVIAPACATARSSEENGMADTIITNARVTTLDRANPEGQAVAVRDGLNQAVGPRDESMQLAHHRTQVIHAGGRRVIPGHNERQTPPIRGRLTHKHRTR